jgi:hypothetical protein
VIVTDPTHPLHGRRFALVSAARSQAVVVYRDDILLKIAVAATDLQDASAPTPVSKLSVDGIRDLLRHAGQLGQFGREKTGDGVQQASKSGRASPNGSPGGMS